MRTLAGDLAGRARGEALTRVGKGDPFAEQRALMAQQNQVPQRMSQAFYPRGY